MSQYDIHTPATAPGKSGALLEQLEKAYGFVPNLAGVLAESPVALESYLALGKIFGKSSLTPAERNEVYLAASAVNECSYCTAAHTATAPEADAPREKLDALNTFTRQVIEKRGWITPEEIQAFLDAGYTKANVLDVITGVAQKTISNYVNHFASTPLDDAFRLA